MPSVTSYRVEFTSSDHDFNDNWRTVGALSAAEFFLARIPDHLLPARIVEVPAQQILAERWPKGRTGG